MTLPLQWCINCFLRQKIFFWSKYGNYGIFLHFKIVFEDCGKIWIALFSPGRISLCTFSRKVTVSSVTYMWQQKFNARQIGWTDFSGAVLWSKDKDKNYRNRNFNISFFDWVVIRSIMHYLIYWSYHVQRHIYVGFLT